MAQASCPFCGENITLAGQITIGTTIHCSACYEGLVVTWLFPLTLGSQRENSYKNPKLKNNNSPKSR